MTHDDYDFPYMDDMTDEDDEYDGAGAGTVLTFVLFAWMLVTANSEYLASRLVDALEGEQSNVERIVLGYEHVAEQSNGTVSTTSSTPMITSSWITLENTGATACLCYTGVDPEQPIEIVEPPKTLYCEGGIPLGQPGCSDVPPPVVEPQGTDS